MTQAPSIDLNADLGEGCAHDAQILEWVSSANIACGAHAGDTETMRLTVGLCLERGVAVGAHPGFEDREHFGRRELEVTPRDAASLVTEQVQRLERVAAQLGARVAHVKLHGALYNLAARDPAIAGAVVAAVAERGQILFALAGSRMVEEARLRGLRVVGEAFADRAYMPDGSLMPRSRPGSVLGDPEAAAAQALRIATEGRVRADGGSDVLVRAGTLCLHGDGPGAVALARRIRVLLDSRGVAVRAP